MNGMARRLATTALFLSGCASAAGGDSPWSLDVDESVTWETVHVLSQVSPDTIPDEYATKEVSPVLSFRCTAGGDGAVSLQIDWQRFISSFATEAGFKIDDGPRDWIKLSVDDSNRITLSTPGEDIASLVSALDGGKALNVEIAPYSEPSVFVSFSLAGFSGALAGLREACN